MSDDRVIGLLPRDARLELQRAAKTGAPGSRARRIAIDKAYRYVEAFYPEFLRRKSEVENRK